MSSTGTHWSKLLVIVFFFSRGDVYYSGLLRIATTSDLFVSVHWTAPLNHNAAFEINPVSSFYCFSCYNRPRFLNPLLVDCKNLTQFCLIILLAGDIEMNPGPKPLKYPCQIHQKAVMVGFMLAASS